MPTTQVKTRVRFGVFELDVRSGELRKSGLKIKLQPQPLQVLLLLIERPGELFTREELQQKLWQGDIFVDFERSLNKAVVRLRESLGDSAESPRYIETLPRLGYRFIAPVQDISGSPTGATPTPSAPEEKDRDLPIIREGDEIPLPAFGQARDNSYAVGQPGAPGTEDRRDDSLLTKKWPLLLAGAALLAIAVLLLRLDVGSWRERLAGRTPQVSIHSIAVLPLENLSHDPEQEYFADGMTEALITELAQISALKVISRTSVMQYKGTKKSLPQIAQELSVDAVVEGAVQRSGDKVGITVQLIQAPSDRHLLAKSYQRDLRDVLALQREIAHAIADEIKMKLTPPEKVRLASTRPINSEAYEDYLKGRFLLSMQKERDVRKGIVYFQVAIQRDPNYALAYAGLANSYISLGQPWVGGLSPQEALLQAKAAATKALEIDDSLGEAHLALARVIQLHDWDWQRVEKEYRRALELNPNDAMGHNWYGEYLQEMGRNEEAFVQMRQAMALDPLSSHSAQELGYVYYTARQFDQAIRAFQKALELEPDDIDALVGLGWVYDEKKMYREAIAELEKAVNLGGRHELVVASLGKVLGDSGRKQEARKLLEELEERSTHRYISPCLIALVQIGLGERDQAIASLEQGYRDRDQWMLYLKVDPHLDDLRSDTRFKDLIRRVGLPQ